MSAESRASAIYHGWVRHRRFTPFNHEFRYRLFMLYLDLDELDSVFEGRWLWSIGRRNLAWWRREDYMGPTDVPLRAALERKLEEAGAPAPEGPIRMLTHVRTFGVCFNPVTFYYVFSKDGRTLETVAAEITNTPWKERHTYVLSPHDNHGRAGVKRHRFKKEFHVSPFIDMGVDYEWIFTVPEDVLTVHMNDHDRAGKPLFDATMILQRQPIGPAQLARALMSYPLLTVRIPIAIYWQALLLKLRGAPVFDHPEPG